MKYDEMNTEEFIKNIQWVEEAKKYANIIICDIDLEGNFVQVTPQVSEILGYSEEELLGMNFKDITYPEDIPENWEKFQKLINREIQAYDIEKRYIRKDGSIIWIFVNCVLVTDENEKALRGMAYMQDITERKRMEEVINRDSKKLMKINSQLQLYIEENEKLMLELRRFRHDVLNILYGLNGYIESKDWTGLKKYFDEIQDQVEVLKDNNLFSIEKIKILALRGLLTAKLMAAKIKNISMQITAESDIIIEDKDIREIDLCEVLGIYLDNAIEASEQAVDKRISVYIHEEADCISIVVENTFKNRPNMAAIAKGLSTKGKGRGLGIKLSKDILLQYPNILHNTFLTPKMFVQELQIIKNHEE
jgi:PAS domain S-box-containing protein